MEIIKLNTTKDKQNITNSILHELPEWFGIEEGIIEYVDKVKSTEFYAAYDENMPIGFISIKANNEYTAEVYVMGIKKNYHQHGIGKELMKIAEKELINKNFKFLMVKTLGESHPDENYRNTRKFYNKAGFYPLEEIKEIWGEKNPCLLMVKAL